MQKENNKDFFIQLLSAWLYFTNNNFPTPTFIVEILDQSIFLDQRIKLDFSSDNLYFHCIQPRNISDTFTIIRDLFRFLQPGLICSTKFDKKLGFSTINHKKDYINVLWTVTTQKSFLQTFYPNNNTRKVKGFQKLPKKEIFFTLQSNSTIYNKPLIPNIVWIFFQVFGL